MSSYFPHYITHHLEDIMKPILKGSAVYEKAKVQCLYSLYFWISISPILTNLISLKSVS